MHALVHSFSRRSRQRRLARLAAIVAAVFGAGTAAAGVANSPWCANRCDQLVLDWNATAHQVIKAADGYADPLAASRALAMMHLAMHDALNAASPQYASYTRTAAVRDADPALAAVTAAHDVLLALYPAQQALLRASLDESAHDAGIGATAVRGAELGREVAVAVLARRSKDGSAGSESYREGRDAGDYRFVPGTDFLFAPHWRKLEPFALRAPEQFRVAAPPALGSSEYTQAFHEVKASGGSTPDAKRTADQTHYAAFWYEFSDAGWNRVARVVSRARPQDLWQRARTFALLNVAMADAYIAGWDSKLHYDFWRPVTAIRMAADDGNPATQADAHWNPLLPTPPIQDHPSTHSALGAAAAVVLAHCFGDKTAFSFASPSALPANPTRSFPSFSAAALENADSRVRAGLHFRFATTRGLQLGRQVGAHAVATLLTPAP